VNFKVEYAVQVKRVAGLDKHKLELKFDTFSQVSTIEEEARFGGCYKFKSSINSFSVSSCIITLLTPLVSELLMRPPRSV
jgi:hypothetical protein